MTGIERLEVASDEDPSVMTVAKLVQSLADEELDEDVSVEFVENPREETLVDSFAIDTSMTRSVLGWAPEHTVETSLCGLLRDLAQR